MCVKYMRYDGSHGLDVTYGIVIILELMDENAIIDVGDVGYGIRIGLTKQFSINGSETDSKTNIMESFSDRLENSGCEEVEQHISKGITLFGASINSTRIRVVLNEKPVIG